MIQKQQFGCFYKSYQGFSDNLLDFIIGGEDKGADFDSSI